MFPRAPFVAVLALTACHDVPMSPEGVGDDVLVRDGFCDRTSCDNADFDHDGLITNDDLTSVLVCAMQNSADVYEGLATCTEDLSGDGVVDSSDLITLSALQGTACAALPPCDGCGAGEDPDLDLLEDLVGVDGFPALADLAVTDRRTDPLGFTHVSLRHVQSCLPVDGGDAVLSMDADGVPTHFSGRPQDAAGVDVVPTFEPADAVTVAQDAWDAQFRAALDHIDLEIVASDGGFVLAWRVALTTGSPASPVAWVHAQTGDLLSLVDRVAEATDVSGTGVSSYYGEVPLQLLEEDETQAAVDFGGTAYHLEAREFSLRSLTSDGGPSSSVFHQPLDTPDIGAGFESLVDVHFAATETLAWLADHGLDGLDGRGGPGSWVSVLPDDGDRLGVVADVADEDREANAFWSPTSRTAYFGIGDATHGSMTSIDIVAHELGHGVQDFAGGLGRGAEAGAVQEHVADAIATAVEHAVLGQTDGTWTLGEDVVTPSIDDGLAVRHLDDPTKDGASAGHMDDWVAPVGDYDARHWNAGIGNQALFLVSEGGRHPTSGVEVTPIGLADAGAIWLRAVTTYLPSEADYGDLRVATLAAAADLHGEDSVQRYAVADAMFSVGVGAAGISPWHNVDYPVDVSGDGFLSPFDALQVINDLNAQGTRLLGLPDEDAPSVDVNGDGYVSSIDALLVINALNAPS